MHIGFLFCFLFYCCFSFLSCTLSHVVRGCFSLIWPFHIVCIGMNRHHTEWSYLQWKLVLCLYMFHCRYGVFSPCGYWTEGYIPTFCTVLLPWLSKWKWEIFQFQWWWKLSKEKCEWSVTLFLYIFARLDYALPKIRYHQSKETEDCDVRLV